VNGITTCFGAFPGSGASRDARTFPLRAQLDRFLMHQPGLRPWKEVNILRRQQHGHPVDELNRWWP
jgi:hypothetical protein